MKLRIFIFCFLLLIFFSCKKTKENNSPNLRKNADNLPACADNEANEYLNLLSKSSDLEILKSRMNADPNTRITQLCAMPLVQETLMKQYLNLCSSVTQIGSCWHTPTESKINFEEGKRQICQEFESKSHKQFDNWTRQVNCPSGPNLRDCSAEDLASLGAYEQISKLDETEKQGYIDGFLDITDGDRSAILNILNTNPKTKENTIKKNTLIAVRNLYSICEKEETYECQRTDSHVTHTQTFIDAHKEICQRTLSTHSQALFDAKEDVEKALKKLPVDLTK